MSKKAPAKKPTIRVRSMSNRTGKSILTPEAQPLQAVDSCCGMAPTSLDSMVDYGRAFERGREAALYDSSESRLKRLRDKLAALTEAVAETAGRLKLLEVERDNCASAIQSIGTSLGF